jgi:tetratricopeptide (TPR) repeat protein
VIASARWFIAVLLLSSALEAGASQTDELNRARNAFAFGNYQEAVKLLEGLLHPVRLRAAEQIVEARQLLGVSYYFLKRFPEAEAEFERLLYLRPQHELDPLLFPPPVIELFEKVRARIRDRLSRLHPEVKEPGAGPAYFVRRIERRHFVLNFFPFGVGQFQNGRPGKAAFFLSSEAATLAANLITYAAAESLRLSNGRFNARDAGTASNLRYAQVATLGGFGALVIAGIIDALVDYRPTIVTEERIERAPGEPPVVPKTRADRLQWSPWIVSGGGGLGMSFRF